MSGSAYVFVRKNGVWSEEQKLLASDGAASDQFGTSVGISGDTVVVGANFDDDKGDKSGAAYVYVRSNGNWTEQQKLVPGDGAAKDYFGQSVAIDGDTLAVGAIENDEAEYNAGAVYVYTRENGEWALQQKLTASDAGLGDEFGAIHRLDLVLSRCLLESIVGCMQLVVANRRSNLCSPMVGRMLAGL